MKRISLALITLGLFLGSVQQARSDFMYWADQNAGEILRANLDGTGQQTLASGQRAPTGIALDLAAGKMYWTNQANPGDIRRANLDGTGQEILLVEIAPYGIALDVANGKMYWTRPIGRDIRRANLDGTGMEILVTGQNEPAGIALDVAAAKMYWANQLSGNTIWQANLDGTGQLILPLSGLREPVDIALDIAEGKMYWTDFQGDIRRANLDGTGQETIVTGQIGAFGVDLDLANGKIYWTRDSIGRDIRRANLDGTEMEILVTGNNPAGIALGTVAQPGALTVLLDVRPGSAENPINPKSNGVISVAVLSTNSFDASTIDQASLRFGPGQALAEGNGHLEDVNGDGQLDLVLHFRTQDSGIQCGDTSVSITGQTVDVTPIQGFDSITTVGCKPVGSGQKKK
jgi:DNA-binding beta-propeller fold protein YncE